MLELTFSNKFLHSMFVGTILLVGFVSFTESASAIDFESVTDSYRMAIFRMDRSLVSHLPIMEDSAFMAYLIDGTSDDNGK